jgi:hypothetical protein
MTFAARQTPLRSSDRRWSSILTEGESTSYQYQQLAYCKNQIVEYLAKIAFVCSALKFHAAASGGCFVALDGRTTAMTVNAKTATIAVHFKYLNPDLIICFSLSVSDERR